MTIETSPRHHGHTMQGRPILVKTEVEYKNAKGIGKEIGDQLPVKWTQNHRPLKTPLHVGVL